MLIIAALLWLETTRPQYEGIEALDYGFPPSFYPRILLAIWAMLAVIVIVRAWVASPVKGEVPRIGRLASAVAITSMYIWLIDEVGFLLASIPFTCVFMLALGYRRPVILAGVTAVFPLLTWWLMTGPLQIVLPVSPWFRSF